MHVAAGVTADAPEAVPEDVVAVPVPVVVCPAVFWFAVVGAVTHLPDEHTLPVMHSVFALHVALHNFLAAAVVVASCVLHILLVHSVAEAQVTPFALLVVATTPVEAVKVPVEGLIAESDIAAPVLSLSPEDNVRGVFAAVAAAHCPVAALHVLPEPHSVFVRHKHVPAVPMAATAVILHLPLVHCEFVVHLPPKGCNAIAGAFMQLPAEHTFPVPHWLFVVHVRRVEPPVETPAPPAALLPALGAVPQSVPHFALHSVMHVLIGFSAGATELNVLVEVPVVTVAAHLPFVPTVLGPAGNGQLLLTHCASATQSSPSAMVPAHTPFVPTVLDPAGSLQ